MTVSELINKQVLIVGLGLTGLSVVRFLERSGIRFEIADEHCTREAVSSIAADVIRHEQFTHELFCRFDVIVLSPGIPRAHPCIVAALEAGVDVIGDIELFADAVQVPVIAVTGSNGKSTVVAWLSFVLEACGMKAPACGNIGKPALDCLDSDAEVLVLELSSYQLESTRSLRPLSATVLNVSDDHLDRYDNMEHYASVKRRVYSRATFNVANLDDRQTWPEAANAENVSYFTLSESTDSHVRWMRSALGGLTPAVPGEHNIANALAVMALAEPLSVPMIALLEALARFPGLAHRSEYLGESRGVRWYNDSKGTNVDACKKAIEAMPGPIVLIAGGMSKGADFAPLREVVAQHVKLLVLMGQDRHIIAAQLEACTRTCMVQSLTEAVSLASDETVAGDVVLLSPACASFDMFRNFEHRGEQYRSAVQEVLAA